jgi:hypothetical protein
MSLAGPSIVTALVVSSGLNPTFVYSSADVDRIFWSYDQLYRVCGNRVTPCDKSSHFHGYGQNSATYAGLANI